MIEEIESNLKLRNNIALLTKECEELKVELTTSKSQLNSILTQITPALNVEFKRFTQPRDELDDSDMQNVTESPELTSKLAAEIDINSDLRSELALKMQDVTRIAELTSRVDELTSKFTREAEANTQLRDELAQASESILKLERMLCIENEDNENALAVLTKQLEGSEVALQASRTESAELRSQCDRTKEEMKEALMEAIRERSDKEAEMEAELRKLREQLAARSLVNYSTAEQAGQIEDEIGRDELAARKVMFDERIAELTHERTTSGKTNTDLVAELAYANSTIQKLESMLNDDEKTELEMKCNELMKQIDDLQSTLGICHAECSELQCENNSLQIKLMETMRQDVEIMAANKIRTESTLDSLDTKWKASTARIVELENMLDSIGKINVNFLDKEELSKTKILQLQSENEMMMRKNEGLDSLVKTLQEQLSMSNMSMQQKVSELSDKEAEMEAELRKLREQLAARSVVAQASHIKTVIPLAASASAQRAAHPTSGVQEVIRIPSISDDSPSRISRLTEELGRKNGELAEQTSRLVGAMEAVVKLEHFICETEKSLQKYADLDDDINMLREQLAYVADSEHHKDLELSRLREHLACLRQELATSFEHSQQKESELARLRDAHSALETIPLSTSPIKVFSKNVANLLDELEESKQTIATLESQLAVFREHLESSQLSQEAVVPPTNESLVELTSPELQSQSGKVEENHLDATRKHLEKEDEIAAIKKDFEFKMEAQVAEVLEAKARNIDLQSEIESLKEAMKKMELCLADLEIALQINGEQESQISCLRKQLISTNRLIEEKDNEVKGLRDKLTRGVDLSSSEPSTTYSLPNNVSSLLNELEGAKQLKAILEFETEVVLQKNAELERDLGKQFIMA